MLHIKAAPDLRDHLSDREVSTVLFLPTSIGSMVGELPRALDISGQWLPITIQKNIKSSRNFKIPRSGSVHLLICTLGKVVIFYDITGVQRGGFL